MTKVDYGKPVSRWRQLRAERGVSKSVAKLMARRGVEPSTPLAPPRKSRLPFGLAQRSG